MKKYAMFSAILFFGIASAQVPKGTQFLSGQIGFSNTKDQSKNSSLTAYKFLPTYGYFFAPNWSAAISVGYKQEIEKSQNTNANLDLLDLEKKTSAFVVTPSMRKFWVLDSHFSLFCQLDFPLGFGSVRQTTNLQNGVEVSQSQNSYSSFGVALKPGIDYFLNPHWKIAASIGEIGYFTTHNKETDTNKNRFNLEGNFSSVQFALKYIIPATKIND